MSIQQLVNMLLFVWLLVITALVVRLGLGRERHTTQSGDEHLMQQVEDCQRLISTMSEDFLALSQRMLQELDDLRVMVQSGPEIKTQVPADQSPSVSRAYTATLPLDCYRSVFQRAAEGQSTTKIAQELGMGKGEVELVLALGRKSAGEWHKS